MAKDPDGVRQLNAQDPHRQAYIIGKAAWWPFLIAVMTIAAAESQSDAFAGSVGAELTKSRGSTSTEPVPTPLHGGTSHSTIDPGEMSIEDYRAWRGRGGGEKR